MTKRERSVNEGPVASQALSPSDMMNVLRNIIEK